MANTEITIKEGTLTYPPMRVKVESGTREDGTKYEVHQNYAPPTFLSQVTDSKGKNAETRLDEMQMQIDGATTEIAQTVNDIVTQRASEDIATKEELDSYLPLTGGTVKGKITEEYENPVLDLINTATSTRARVQQASNGKAQLVNYTDSDNWAGVAISLPAESTSNLLRFIQYYKGTKTDINIHHDGNSAKVVQATSAPTDTTYLWYDTNTSKLKSYIDGAWQ